MKKKLNPRTVMGLLNNWWSRGSALQTCAVTYDTDGWYYPQKQTLSWMKNELKEKTSDDLKALRQLIHNSFSNK